MTDPQPMLDDARRWSRSLGREPGGVAEAVVELLGICAR